MLEKGIAAALADELLDTVIQKFQIPGSGAQLKVQALAIRELMKILEDEAGLRFPKGTDQMITVVQRQMPAVFGTVPSDFYVLRHAVEQPLKHDPFLQHVEMVHRLRGDRRNLYELIPILKNPDIPQDFKDHMMDGSIMLMADTATLDSVKVLIEEMGGKYKLKMLSQIAPHYEAAEVGDRLKAATEEGFRTGNWDGLYQADFDGLAMMEVCARADAVLDPLFQHYRSLYYDKPENQPKNSL